MSPVSLLEDQRTKLPLLFPNQEALTARVGLDRGWDHRVTSLGWCKSAYHSEQHHTAKAKCHLNPGHFSKEKIRNMYTVCFVKK